MRIIFFFIVFLFFKLSVTAQQVIIGGRVTDAQTGEILSDVNIIDKKSGIGVSSNGYGLYTIRVNKGVCVLQTSMLGYKTRLDTLRIVINKTVDLSLEPNNYLLDQVEIQGVRMHTGQFRLDQKDIQSIPVAGGEPDLLKALQFLPGVAAGNEGANNLSIRGSNQWGNLVLLDEAVVYNPNHALSFFSVFNNDAIQKVNLYKSYFPLNYGGRSAAVIDVRMKEGNSKKQYGQMTIGTIASKLLWEGPFKSKKGSYLVAVRGAYPGAVLGLLNAIDRTNTTDRLYKTEMYFYDVNAKVNRIIDDSNRIYFSLYNGGDHTLFPSLVKGYGMNWGNSTATFRWNHVANEKLNTNGSAIFSRYYYRYKSLMDGLRYTWKAHMQSYQLKYDIEYTPSNILKFKMGSALNLFSTIPGSVDKYGEDSNISPYSMKRRQMQEIAFYGETGWSLGNGFVLNGGIRLTGLYAHAVKPYKAKFFILPEPRMELSYVPDKKNKINVSFNCSSQTLHMLSSSSVGLPSDVWLPVNAKLKPSTMLQVTVGYERNIQESAYTCSLEGYYRKSNEIVDYKDNANLFLNDRLEEQLLFGGKSKGYGIECYFAKNHGILTGKISYTYSRALNRIEGIEGGKEYPSATDRPHNLKLFLNIALSSRWNVSSTFSYHSGMNLTLPVGQYFYDEYMYYIYSSRNGYRAPAFHQLDFSITYHSHRSAITLSIINAYNRKNVFTMYAARDGGDEPQGYKMYLYGVLPSLSYSLNF